MKLNSQDTTAKSRVLSQSMDSSGTLKKTRQISLRTLAIVPFVIEIIAVVGLVGYLSFKNGQQAVNELALNLQDKATGRVIDRLDNYLEQPQLINQINVDAANIGELPQSNLSNLERHFWQQIKVFKSVNSIYLGTPTGEIIGIDRETDGTLIAKITEDFPNRNFYLLDEKGKRTQLIKVQPNYDTRNRPWFVKALQEKQAVWSEIYIYANNNALGITSAQPFYDEKGTLKGVFGIDISLKSISNFLRHLKISPSGHVFIMERSGQLVATSSITLPYILDRKGDNLHRIAATESGDRLISSVARYLNKDTNINTIQKPRQIDARIDGKRQLIQVVPYRNKAGLDWLVVAIVPEDDFLSNIQANTYRTILLCLAALAVAIAIGIFISYKITRPILQLSEACQKLVKKELDRAIDAQGIKELEVLAVSFENMKDELDRHSQQLEVKIQERTVQLEQANQQLQQLATLDSLTKIANRRRFEEYIYQEWKRMARDKQMLSLILFDVDYFKRYNDRYGHQAGDTCLRKIAKAANASVKRSVDLVARYGGEEFAVILPNTLAEGAMHVAETIRDRIKQLKIPHERSEISKFVTISLGIASLIPSSEDSPNELIAKADNALYEAKQQGRDRTVISDQ
jgi:diguanylate cyclase (GGDEF)-like protein